MDESMGMKIKKVVNLQNMVYDDSIFEISGKDKILILFYKVIATLIPKLERSHK